MGIQTTVSQYHDFDHNGKLYEYSKSEFNAEKRYADLYARMGWQFRDTDVAEHLIVVSRPECIRALFIYDETLRSDGYGYDRELMSVELPNGTVFFAADAKSVQNVLGNVFLTCDTVYKKVVD